MTLQSDALGTAEIGGIERHATGSIGRLVVHVLSIGAVLALVPLWLGDSRVLMGVAVLGAAFACYVVAFNLIFGSTGQLFLCLGALAGIGGYGSVILADTVGIPLLPAILAGTALAGMTGAILSFVAVRRSLGVIFTGIITLVFDLVFQNMLLGLGELTGGESGFQPQAAADTILRETSRIPPYYVMLGLVLLFVFIHGLLRWSHFGWAFRALRDDEVAAELAGVDVGRYRVIAALIGSSMLGLAGATYAFTERVISPSSFGFAQIDVVALVMLAFGGIGKLYGPVLGAAVFTAVDEFLLELGQLRELIFGVLIILLFLFIPNGIIERVGSLVVRSARPDDPPER